MAVTGLEEGDDLALEGFESDGGAVGHIRKLSKKW